MKRLSLVLLLLLSPSLRAGWSFTATLSQSGPCYSSSYTGYTLPAISGMPKKEMCESARSQVLAIKECYARYATSPPYNFIGNCCVFYACTPCTGFDDNYGANSTGPGSAGGNFNSAGAASGRPFFSSNPNTENLSWARESEERIQSLGSGRGAGQAPRIQAPSTGNQAFDQDYFKQMARAYVDPKVWRTAYPTQYAPGDERSSADEQVEFRAAGTDEAAQAQPLGGAGVQAPASSSDAPAGVTQGKPDATPPPNPRPPHTSNSRRCDPGWWHNKTTNNCYYSQSQCEKNSKPGDCKQTPK